MSEEFVKTDFGNRFKRSKILGKWLYCKLKVGGGERLKKICWPNSSAIVASFNM